MRNEDRISCQWVLERLEAHLDGELASHDASGLEAHLRICDSCARERAIAEQLRGALRCLPQKICPDRVLDNFSKRISDDMGKKKRALSLWPRGARWWVARPAAIAAVLVIIAVVSLMIRHGDRLPFSTFPYSADTQRFSAETVTIAEAEVKWTLAYIGDIGRRAGFAVRDDAIRRHVIAPVHRAVESAIDGKDAKQP